VVSDGNCRWKKAREVMSNKFGRMLLEGHVENNLNYYESNEFIPSALTNFVNESKRAVFRSAWNLSRLRE